MRWLALAAFFALVACDDGAGIGDASPPGAGDASPPGADASPPGADAAPVVRGTCEAPPVAEGLLRNDVADIDFTGEPVEAEVEHKLDIDVDEDGCVVGARFRLRKAGLGCELSLAFASAGGAPIALTEARLAADSFCPGWSDDDEGEYTLASGAPALRFVARVPDRTARSSCIGATTARFSGRVRLARADGRTIEVDLGGFAIRGDFPSAGDTEAACPCAPRCGERACGPDPVCGVECGACPDTESCTPEGTCACVPRCDGRECGDDGCGGACGPGCAGGVACDPDTGRCDCVPACEGRECGADGCGGTCGPGCGAGDACDPATGRCGCVPACGGRECGSDGCGGSCGPGCGADAACDEGRCTDVCPAENCLADFAVEDAADLAAVASCGHIEGNLYVDGAGVADLSALECLRSITGELVLRGTGLAEIAALTRLETAGTIRLERNVAVRRVAFPALREVADALALGDAPALVTLDFPALRTIGGPLGLAGLDALADLSGFSALESARSLNLDRMDVLPDLGGLASLRTLRYLNLRNNPRLRSLSGLDALDALPDGGVIVGNGQLRDLRGLGGVRATGSLVIRSNGALTTLAGLERLESAAGLTVDANAALTGTGALAALATVTNRLDLTSNGSLASLELPALTAVGTLTLERLRMRDLDGLAAVRRIDDALRIESNALLTSLDGLGAARVAGIIVIHDNRALDQCEAEAFAARVSASNRVTVTDNAACE